GAARAYAVSGGGCPQLHRRISSSRTTRYLSATYGGDDADQRTVPIPFVASRRPFFLYYAPGGSHAPHQPTPEWIAKFKGKFDMGWNELREKIFANQKRLGVIPSGTQLTPWPDVLQKWDT